MDNIVKFYTRSEAASELKITPVGIDSARKKRTLKAFRQGGLWFYTQEALDDYKKNHLRKKVNK